MEKNPNATGGNVQVMPTQNMAEPMKAYNLPSQKDMDEFLAFIQNYDKLVNKVLVDGTDYGQIPGVEKATLLKPGAEKLEKLFFLRSKKTCILREVTENGNFIRYTYRTEVYNKAGEVVSTCEGTCNSKEKKYRSQTVFDNQATEEQKAKGKKQTRKSQNGNEYSIYVVDKEDFYDLENTIMKMAQKRSYVGAILEATNSSSRFTQDIEDMDESVIHYDNHATPAKAAAAEKGKGISPLFEKAKKNLSHNKDVDGLKTFRVKIEGSDKYDAQQKAELIAIIDKNIQENETKTVPVTKSKDPMEA